MSERNVLKKALESNEEFRNILVGLALKVAIGDSSSNGSIKNENELNDLLNKALDAIEELLSSVALLCRALANKRGKNDIEALWTKLVNNLFILSELDEAICQYQGITPYGIDYLFGKAKYQASPWHNPWYEIACNRLPSWVDTIAKHAMMIDKMITSQRGSIGMGYITNIPLIDPDHIPHELEQRTQILTDYLSRDISPFIMRTRDYGEFIDSVFAERFGHYDADNKTHVHLRREMNIAAISFKCKIDSGIEDCVVVPVQYGEAWWKSYDTVEKRWIIDAPRISRKVIGQLIKVMKSSGLSEPDLPMIAKKGSLW